MGGCSGWVGGGWVRWGHAIGLHSHTLALQLGLTLTLWLEFQLNPSRIPAGFQLKSSRIPAEFQQRSSGRAARQPQEAALRREQKQQESNKSSTDAGKRKTLSRKSSKHSMTPTENSSSATDPSIQKWSCVSKRATKRLVKRSSSAFRNAWFAFRCACGRMSLICSAFRLVAFPRFLETLSMSCNFGETLRFAFRGPLSAR